MKWSDGALWASFAVSLAWGAELALTVASLIGIGPWPSVERLLLGAACTGTMGLMQHRYRQPVVNGFRDGRAYERRRSTDAQDDGPGATIHQIR